MANRFILLNLVPDIEDSLVKESFSFYDGQYKYNLSSRYEDNKQQKLKYFNVNNLGGITELLNRLNGVSSNKKPKKPLPDLHWLVGSFKPDTVNKYLTGLGQVKILPVESVGTEENGTKTYRYEIIIDTDSVAAAPAQPGGSLYDNKGKLLYRGGMKNGLPHGYGTGYYANGKVGYVGMFKAGKIVQ